MSSRKLTAAQAERIIAVIESDATLRYRYYDSEGNACVIGGLADACGLSDELTLAYEAMEDGAGAGIARLDYLGGCAMPCREPYWECDAHRVVAFEPCPTCWAETTWANGRVSLPRPSSKCSQLCYERYSTACALNAYASMIAHVAQR